MSEKETVEFHVAKKAVTNSDLVLTADEEELIRHCRHHLKTGEDLEIKRDAQGQLKFYRVKRVRVQ